MFVICLHCSKKFEKSITNIKNSPNHFCSKSCSACFNNKIPKRKKTKKCFSCDNLVLSNRKFCKNCQRSKSENLTLKDLLCKTQYRSSIYVRVRLHARQVANKQNWKCCSKCGYDKHIEIAHIKAISSYNDDASLSEINDVSNLIPLCPNCHWEFDNLPRVL